MPVQESEKNESNTSKRFVWLLKYVELIRGRENAFSKVSWQQKNKHPRTRVMGMNREM